MGRKPNQDKPGDLPPSVIICISEEDVEMLNTECMSKMCRLSRLIQVVVTCVIMIPGYSQRDSTFTLAEVSIVGIDLSRFSSGTLLQEVRPMNSGVLSEMNRTTSIHFKNYGNQQLSTITFRGTSASHTNVVWNGIQVNSPTLGQTDFSVWPMFLTDQILIQHGGGSSLLGSGAIGGSVLLDNSQFQKDSLVTLYGATGSFGQYDGGLKLQFDVSEQLKLEYRGYYGQIQNDFPLEGGGRQPHAAVKRYGASQKINYQHKQGALFSELAYVQNDRDVQPTITSASRSTLESTNFRAVINNKWNGQLGEHDALIGLINDKTVFNDSSITSSYRLTTTYSFSKPVGTQLLFRVGGTMLNEWVNSENFGGTERQNQLQLFTSLTYYPLPALGITANLREILIENQDVFIPSLGADYNLLHDGNNRIQIRGQLSRDFRVPTFNDLFWRPGGNPGLLPERSANLEGGFDFLFNNATINLTGFYSDIQNWIQWSPREGGIWSPRNLRRVKTKGIELNTDFGWSVSDLLFDFVTSYTYVRSEDQGIDAENQLPYVPEHELMVNLSTTYDRYSLSLIGNYTGVRFTTLTNSLSSEVDPFFIMDLALGGSFSVLNVPLSIQTHVRNLLNARYQIVKNHAMPGRSVQIELTTKF